MAGACATILKAAFDGSVQFNFLSNSAIVTASVDGISYIGADENQLITDGEINHWLENRKARDFAGIHWPSDYECGLRLGEAAALSVFSDQSNNYAGEDFDGFVITKFYGATGVRLRLSIDLPLDISLPR